MTNESFETIVSDIELWARERGLDKPVSSRSQLLKLVEEVGELVQGDLKEKPDQVKDSIGDVMVVLTIYCLQTGTNLHDSFKLARDTIKNRKGKMIDGVYVKDADLPVENEKPETAAPQKHRTRAQVTLLNVYTKLYNLIGHEAAAKIYHDAEKQVQLTSEVPDDAQANLMTTYLRTSLNEEEDKRRKQGSKNG